MDGNVERREEYKLSESHLSLLVTNPWLGDSWPSCSRPSVTAKPTLHIAVHQLKDKACKSWVVFLSCCFFPDKY